MKTLGEVRSMNRPVKLNQHQTQHTGLWQLTVMKNNVFLTRKLLEVHPAKTKLLKCFQIYSPRLKNWVDINFQHLFKKKDKKGNSKVNQNSIFVFLPETTEWKQVITVFFVAHIDYQKFDDLFNHSYLCEFDNCHSPSFSSVQLCFCSPSTHHQVQI